MRKKIPFSDKMLKVPVIEFTYGDKIQYALIDSGSELTLFDTCFEDAEPGTVLYDIDLTGAGGTDKCSASKLTVRMYCFDEGDDVVVFDVQGLYMAKSNIFKDTNSVYGDKIRIDCIIGSDTLKRLNARIDYKQNVLVIDDLSCQ